MEYAFDISRPLPISRSILPNALAIMPHYVFAFLLTPMEWSDLLGDKLDLFPSQANMGDQLREWRRSGCYEKYGCVMFMLTMHCDFP